MEATDTAVPATDTQTPDGGSEFESMAIPETYKESAVGKYATVGELVKGYDNAQKLIGAKGVIVPSEKATPEEYEKFYNSLGRPEKPDGYKFSPVEKLHPSIKIMPEDDKAFKTLMHKHGIPQRQADALRKDYFSMASQILEKKDKESISAKEQAETALRQEWGADYDTKLQKAQRLIDKFGGESGRTDFGELGNNPKALKILASIADKFSEDTFVPESGRPSSEVHEATKKLKDIMDDKKHPFWNTGLGHDDAVMEVRRLNEIITPNDRVATHPEA